MGKVLKVGKRGPFKKQNELGVFRAYLSLLSAIARNSAFIERI
jgi:hypothetical protein